ncbi:MAG: excinuclease ABC subunit C, partial [Clostridia bacterium]|nr:excinuclease ABC subunit C [Clostridia bacterium]
MRRDLEDKIKMLPDSPGVYVMLNSDGQIIYVGKAKILKNRVKQYFYSNKKPEKVAAMVSNIADFYYIITQSEIDALSLENNLIKKHKPRYNILLKDDKTYPYIRVNLKETFPAFSVTRKIRRDGARYFGPYMGGVNVKDTLEIVNGAFSLRPCSYSLDGEKLRKPCLNYHIKKCLAPCAGYCTEEEYKNRVNGAIDFRSGTDDGGYELLKAQMAKFAEKEEFEIALSYREKLKMLEKIKLKRITALNKFVDMDVIAVSSNGIYSAVNMLFIRGGRMQGGKNFPLDDVETSDSDRLRAFMIQYYTSNAEVPDDILVPEEFSDSSALAEYIKTELYKSVKIYTAERGVKRQLLSMAK